MISELAINTSSNVSIYVISLIKQEIHKEMIKLLGHFPDIELISGTERQLPWVSDHHLSPLNLSLLFFKYGIEKIITDTHKQVDLTASEINFKFFKYGFEWSCELNQDHFRNVFMSWEDLLVKTAGEKYSADNLKNIINLIKLKEETIVKFDNQIAELMNG